MADNNASKPGLNLFGLGALKREAPARRDMSATGSLGLEAASSDVLSLNLKALAAALQPPPAAPMLGLADLRSRAPVIADISSPWFNYWATGLRSRVRPHRKLWEFIIVLQALYESGALTKGAKVLGLGVGGEPLPSYLASLGLSVVATDLPGFAERETIWREDLVSAEAFDAQVEVSNLDMRRMDDTTLRGFDALWSCSVLNTFSTEVQAAEAVIDAMDALKPGGVAVHVTEWAFADDRPAFDPGRLAFPRAFFEKLAQGLNGRKHQVLPLSFDLGSHALDGYVDAPPFSLTGSEAFEALWQEGSSAPHLKVADGDTMRTSFALVVRART
jgi:hypothetical protein